MKTDEVLKQIEETGIITEQQINLLKIRKNKDRSINIDFISDGNVKLTPEQNKKGIEFLLNVHQTPRGIERKNTPFKHREIETLKSFTHFEFKGFYNAGNHGIDHHISLYLCCGNNGEFLYYYDGDVNIIG